MSGTSISQVASFASHTNKITGQNRVLCAVGVREAHVRNEAIDSRAKSACHGPSLTLRGGYLL